MVSPRLRGETRHANPREQRNRTMCGSPQSMPRPRVARRRVIMAQASTLPPEKPRTMPRSLAEYNYGYPLLVGIVLLNGLLAATATVLCAWAYLDDIESVRSVWGVLIAVPAMWWVMTLTLWVTTITRHRVTSEVIRRASAKLPAGVLLPGTKLVPMMTLVSGLAMASTLIVFAVTAGGVWGLVFTLLAVLLLGPIVSLIVSLQQPRRLFLHPRRLGSASFHLDAEVNWDDIDGIDYGVGMNHRMVLKVRVRHGSQSYQELWRHPFFRKRGVIDIDPSALGVDGTLLWLALRLYRCEPSARDELRGDRVPSRLHNAREARATTPQYVSEPVLARFTPEDYAE